MLKTLASRWFRWIDASFAVDPIQRFSLVVVRSQVVVIEWPCRRNPFLQRQVGEVLFAHALEHCSPDFGVSANGVKRLW